MIRLRTSCDFLTTSQGCHICHMPHRTEELWLLALQYWAALIADEGLCIGKCWCTYCRRKCAPWSSGYCPDIVQSCCIADILQHARARCHWVPDSFEIWRSKHNMGWTQYHRSSLQEWEGPDCYWHFHVSFNLVILPTFFCIQRTGVPIADALKNPLTPAWTSGRGETLAWWDFILDDWMTFIGRYTAEVCVCRSTVNFRRSLPLTVLLWVQAFFASLILFDSSMLYRHLLPAVFSCSSSCGEHPPRFLSNLNRPVPSAWATSMARWLPSLALNMSYPNIDPDSKPFLIVSSLYFFHVSFLHI